MEIDWENRTATLFPHEQAAIGDYVWRVYGIDFINSQIFMWRDNLTAHRDRLDGMRAADDDEFSHFQRNSIVRNLAMVERRLRVIESMAAQILTGELDRPQDL